MDRRVCILLLSVIQNDLPSKFLTEPFMHVFLIFFFIPCPGPPPASVSELRTQEASSTSRDPVPISYQLKVRWHHIMALLCDAFWIELISWFEEGCFVLNIELLLFTVPLTFIILVVKIYTMKCGMKKLRLMSASFDTYRIHPIFSERACCLSTGRCFTSCVTWMCQGRLRRCAVTAFLLSTLFFCFLCSCSPFVLCPGFLHTQHSPIYLLLFFSF